MKKLIWSSALLAALCIPALAGGGMGGNGGNGGGMGGNNNMGGNGGNGGNVHGAPGPIAGSGLPVIAVGFGVYWLIRRRRRTPE